MRRALIPIVLLAACYRPARDSCAIACGTNELCPDGYTCSNTFCALGSATCSPNGGEIDAAVDGVPGDMMPDGTPSPDQCDIPNGTPQSDTPFTNVFGRWFVGVFANDFPAAMLGNDGAGLPAIYVQLGQAFNGPFQVAIDSDANAGIKVDAPRLSPNGTEIFFHRVDVTNAVHAISVSVRGSNTDVWSMPTDLMLVGSASDLSLADPSPPTTTDPRHMIISYGAGSYEELVQIGGIASRQWMTIDHVDNPSFGVQWSGQASLTADAKFLVFRGNSGGLNGAFYVARQPDGHFGGTAQPLLGTTSSVNEPYLAPDCHHLFYSDNTPPFQVHMVTYP